MLYFVIIFLLIYGFLAWKRSDWALMLMFFLLPSYQIRFSVFGIPSTLLEGMILVLFAVWILKNYKQVFENLKARTKLGNSEIKKSGIVRYPFSVEIVLLLVISFAAVGVAGFSNSALGIWKAYFFEPILVYLLVFNVFRDYANPQISANSQIASNDNASSRISIEKIIWPLILSALVVSTIAILQKLGIIYSPANFWPRVTSVFPYPNAVGLYLGPLFPLLVGYTAHLIFNFQIFKQFSIFKFSKLIFLFIVIILSAMAIIFAGSEGALAGVLAAGGIMAIFYFAYKFESRVLNILGKTMVGAILIFVILSPWFFLKIVPENKYFNFQNQALNYVSDKLMLKDFSGEVRKQQWRETWEMMRANPKILLFGTGLSDYQASVKPYHQEGIFFNHERDTDFRRKIVWFDEKYKAEHWRPVEIYMYPHNFFLNFICEIGILGAILFIWIIIKAVYQIFNFKFLILKQFSISNFQYLQYGILGVFIVILVHGLVDVPYFKNDLAVMFWIIVATTGIINLDLKLRIKK